MECLSYGMNILTHRQALIDFAPLAPTIRRNSFPLWANDGSQACPARWLKCERSRTFRRTHTCTLPPVLSDSVAPGSVPGRPKYFRPVVFVFRSGVCP